MDTKLQNCTERPNSQIRAIQKILRQKPKQSSKKFQPRNHDTQMETKLQKLYRETEFADQSHSKNSMTQAEAEVVQKTI